MSIYSLTKGSEAALQLLASTGGNDTLLLVQPSRELRPAISLEVLPAIDAASGFKLEAVLHLREQQHSMTLQAGDSANAQHLADWVEAIANGTLDTAEAIPQRPEPSDLAAATAAFSMAARELNTKTQQAPVETALLDALKRHRIALTPEYEGRWHADLYGSFEKPVFSAEGDTPEEAVDAVIRCALSASSPTA